MRIVLPPPVGSPQFLGAGHQRFGVTLSLWWLRSAFLSIHVADGFDPKPAREDRSTGAIGTAGPEVNVPG